VYYDWTVSLCSTCLRRVGAKIVFQDGGVYFLKRCPEHGAERVLVADDIEYYRHARNDFLKAGEMPKTFHTRVEWGCPYDCGLCPDHEQHSCLSLVEICDACNLSCPVCYAGSGPERQSYRTPADVEAMLDAVCASEGEPDVVQISGGEPAEHPDLFAILDAAKARPIRHLMLNTNGVRIANDAAFAERLAGYAPGFEVYLQFDSLRAGPLLELRGADLTSIRARALDRLEALGLSTTLVVTLKRGVNDDECGAIIEHALARRCVRGVTFQPIQDAGRNTGFDPARDRLTLTEVRRRIAEQSSVFALEDLVPVPCHPDCIAMAYALKDRGSVQPLTRWIDPALLVDGARNTITFEREEGLRKGIFEAFSTHHSPTSGADAVRRLLCCLPGFESPPGFSYENLFRVIVMQFLDAHSMDLRSVRKSCVHIVHPTDGRMIPFDTYNLFYRDDLERERLAPLRAAVARAAGDPIPSP
jgi:hypothetical protein